MKGDLLLKNGFVVTEYGVYKSDLLIKDGRIAGFTGEAEAEADVTGLYITPGFTDIHIHGRYSLCSETDIPALSKALARDGVTSFCPTTMTGPLDKTLETLKNMSRDIHEYADGAEPLGIYSEGMFFSREKCGAQDPEYLIAPTDEVIDKMLSAAGGKLAAVALAPETENAAGATKKLCENGVRTSIAHTSGSFEDAKAVIEAGATGSTHTYNAMTGFNHKKTGIPGAVLTDDRVYCELICDGHHVAAPAVNMLYRCKPDDKVILISDNLTDAGSDKKTCVSGGLPVLNLGDRFVLENSPDTLAGSALPLADMFKNYIEFTGGDVVSAVKAASTNAARYLGVYEDRGSIAVGKRADLNVFDKDFNLLCTYVKGEKV